MTARWPRAVSPLLWAFVLLSVVHLGALVAGVLPVVQITKPALMPVLVGYALARGGPPLLAGALLFGCGGDTFLQIGGDLAFLVGMGSFAAGHVCYLLLFARHGAAPAGGRRGRTAAAGAAYAVLLAGTVVLLWPDLPAELRIPVAGYSLLLTAMAFGALRAGPWATVGGLLFLLSDTLIASRIAHWPQLPVPQFWIMLTYVAAQWALADGVRRSIVTAPWSTPRRERELRTAGAP
ncbi:lysoplasmalogenase [Streptomyces tubercidicus]|uniref:lysoplasmalogenase n=1 Tax=Streptomyces tubercidicus TaxID=47759 RepID=UPI002E15F905|nr:lysoplasmalogenase [Streptomyces tubercidicus]WSX19846.1 lysoplasmalogenase [Streptomyces tubercidicus]